MRKKKILFVSEASWKSTGYSVYTKEILSRLCQLERLEVAELACYVGPEDPSVYDRPWKVYPNRPANGSPELENYKGRSTAIFGEQTFNSVCLNFTPDIVMDIRDWWMVEYQQRSPFRNMFHWALMPTVDAAPQNPQWINTFQSADSVFAYSEFGRDTMLKQSDSLNFVDIASPAASQNFRPAENKDAHKEAMGISSRSTIIGTVMRNQRRKLYPDLFKSFRKILDTTKDPNLFLYCHTYYPDIGWDIPNLLNEHGLNNRVLFTYKCKKCGHISVDFFQDSISHCSNCGNFDRQLVGIDNSIEEQDLNNIYNCFDIYVQYANSEGFGMPQLEAAYAGLPVVGTNYSAMESVLKNIGGYSIDPIELSMEAETGCYRAVPDNQKFIDTIIKLLAEKDSLRDIGSETSRRAREHYSWDKTADAWLKRIDSVQLRDLSETWLSPPDIFQPATQFPADCNDILDKVNFIFKNVLNKPNWIGNYLWSKVMKDCMYGFRLQSSSADFYYNESHVQDMNRYESFNVDAALEEMIRFRGQMNEWERTRVNVLGGRT